MGVHKQSHQNIEICQKPQSTHLHLVYTGAAEPGGQGGGQMPPKILDFTNKILRKTIFQKNCK